jgi:hypothetical protein
VRSCHQYRLTGGPDKALLARVSRRGQLAVIGGSGRYPIGAFKGQVRSLAWLDGSLWVAGVFSLGSANPIEGLAIWDGTQWSAPPGGALVGAAFELFVEGNTMFVGGSIDHIAAGGEACEVKR